MTIPQIIRGRKGLTMRKHTPISTIRKPILIATSSARLKYSLCCMQAPFVDSLPAEYSNRDRALRRLNTRDLQKPVGRKSTVCLAANPQLAHESFEKPDHP